MRIAFFGLPLAALLLSGDGHDLVFAGLSRTDVPGARRLRKRIGASRVRIKPRLDEALASRLGSLDIDLVVSWFWTTRLPMSLVACARYGGIGVHPSLLPRHRGPDPTTWAILSGDAETGVTAHGIAAEYDTGAILAQERLAIDPRWNAWQLAKALDRPSLRLLRATCRAFAEGRAPEPIAQREDLATDAPFLSEEQHEIRWATSTQSIERLVRALAPSPGAWTELAGETLTLLRVEACAAPRVLERPGEAASIAGCCVVRTSDGALRILEAEREDERLDARAIAALVARAGT